MTKENLRKAFDVNYHVQNCKVGDINEDLEQIASLLAFYGEQSARWEAAIDFGKQQLDLKEADLTIEIRSGGEKVTESTLSAMITRDSDVQKLRSGIRLAKEQAALYKNAIKAIDRKGDMLVSRGANLRTEYNKTGLLVSENTNNKMSGDRRQELLDRAMNR